MAINSDVALSSAVYGRLQIWGFNHAAVGFAYWRKAATGEDEGRHLDAIVSFIRFDPSMRRNLRSHERGRFAAACHGSGFAAHEPHTHTAAPSVRCDQ